MYSRCPLRQDFDQFRQQRKSQMICHSDSEMVGRSVRNKFRSPQDAFNRRERALRFVVDVRSQSRQLDALPSLRQQFVIEHFLQLIKNPAHGRLADEHASRCARDAAFFNQGLKACQQIEIRAD
jgi:hypothetical protein